MLGTAVLVIYSHSQSAGAASSQEKDLRSQWLKYTLSTVNGSTDTASEDAHLLCQNWQ